MGLFGKKPNPEELAKEWRTRLREEQRGMDRQIREIERGEAKAKQQLQAMAKRGDTASARIMAKELVRSRKAVERLHTAKAQLNSVSLQLQTNMATIRLSGVMKDSTGVLQSMHEAIAAPELRQVMMQMSKEFTKAGMMEEMMDQVMDDALGTADEEDVADELVDSIITEITMGQLTAAGTVGTGRIKTAAPVQQQEENVEATRLAARMAALG